MIMTLPDYKQERLANFKKQMIQAGVTGMLAGSMVALVSGYYLSYRHNHGVNARFFNTPYKLAYFLCFNMAGIIFCTDQAKLKLRKQALIEDEIRREAYIQKELSGEE